MHGNGKLTDVEKLATGNSAMNSSHVLERAEACTESRSSQQVFGCSTQGPQANMRATQGCPIIWDSCSSYLLPTAGSLGSEELSSSSVWRTSGCATCNAALCFLSLSHWASSSKTRGWVPWAHATTLHIWNGPGVFHNLQTRKMLILTDISEQSYSHVNKDLSSHQAGQQWFWLFR